MYVFSSELKQMSPFCTSLHTPHTPHRPLVQMGLQLSRLHHVCSELSEACKALESEGDGWRIACVLKTTPTLGSVKGTSIGTAFCLTCIRQQLGVLSLMALWNFNENQRIPSQGFPALALWAPWAGLCWGAGCPGHCSMSGSIYANPREKWPPPTRCQPDPPLWQPKMPPEVAQCLLGP